MPNQPSGTVTRTATYQIGLASWLDSEGISRDVVPDLLEGTWDLGNDGHLQFAGNTFSWTQDKLTDDAPPLNGFFGISPGARTNTRYVLTTDDGSPVYSLYLNVKQNQVTNADDTETTDDRWGLYVIHLFDEGKRMTLIDTAIGLAMAGVRLPSESH